MFASGMWQEVFVLSIDKRDGDLQTCFCSLLEMVPLNATIEILRFGPATIDIFSQFSSHASRGRDV